MNNLLQEKILEIESLKVSSNNNKIKNENNFNFQNELKEKISDINKITSLELIINEKKK